MDEFTPDYIIDDIVETLLQYDRQGDFVTRIFTAWQIADPGNKVLIRNVVISIIEKYHLEDKFNEILEHIPGVKADSELYRKANEHRVIIEMDCAHIHNFGDDGKCFICTLTRKQILGRG